MNILTNLPHLQVEPIEHGLIVRLDRTESKNAISLEMIESLTGVLTAADIDPNVRVVILCGNGNTFCSGGDLKDMQQRTGMFKGNAETLRYRYRQGIQRIPLMLSRFEKPIIAAINGPAIGAGLDLACMCDIRIAANSSTFGETFARLGLISGDGGSYFLQRVVGFSKAMELSLTAEVIDSSTALMIGLVNKIVREDELIPHCLAIAKTISRNSPSALRLIKKSIQLAYRQTVEEHLEVAAIMQGAVQNGPDHLAALNAMQRKEKAEFHPEDYR
jgi:enoyl-CoA hydratase/carnithine racemase